MVSYPIIYSTHYPCILITCCFLAVSSKKLALCSGNLLFKSPMAMLAAGCGWKRAKIQLLLFTNLRRSKLILTSSCVLWNIFLIVWFMLSKAKHEYAHTGPHCLTHWIVCLRRWHFMVAAFGPALFIQHVIQTLNTLSCKRLCTASTHSAVSCIGLCSY